MKKKFLLMLTITFVALFSVGALNASAENYGDFKYKISNGEVTITDCYGPATEVKIPESIEGYPVTTIGRYAFWARYSVISVTIPDSVTTIEEYAFDACSSLSSITIPDSVTTIDDSAFHDCESLANINVDSNNNYYSSLEGNLYNKDKTTLIQYAIGKTDTHFAIPDSVIIIGSWAFRNCSSLESVTIGKSVTTIGSWVFSYCDNLKSIDVDNSNRYYSSLHGNLYNKNKTTLIRYAIGKTNNHFAIPDGVTTIGENAFRNCLSLASVTIPDSVTTIGEYAFYETGYYIDNNNWENGVLYIGNHLISGSNSISGSYAIKDGTKTIADSAFYFCDSLTSVTIPDSVTTIGDWAFYYCSSLAQVCYNGTEEDWSKIAIGSYNSCLTDTSRKYFYYVTLIDKDGRKICKKMQDVNTLIDISEIIIPDGYYMVLYTDEEKTAVYDTSVPVNENLTIYVDFIEINFSGTKTTVSGDKKSFSVTPINIECGKTVILALYNGDDFVEAQSAEYSGEAVPFTTDKTYTDAKVMVWDNLESSMPVCNVEKVE